MAGAQVESKGSDSPGTRIMGICEPMGWELETEPRSSIRAKSAHSYCAIPLIIAMHSLQLEANSFKDLFSYFLQQF